MSFVQTTRNGQIKRNCAFHARGQKDFVQHFIVVRNPILNKDFLQKQGDLEFWTTEAIEKASVAHYCQSRKNMHNQEVSLQMVTFGCQEAIDGFACPRY